MRALTPPDIRPPTTAEDDLRLGHLLARHLDPDSPPRVVLVGFPTDVGVTRNGGRAGAASAPRAIREVLYRLTPDGERPEGFAELLARTHDLGDVVTSADLERDQLALAEIIAPHLERGTFVIVLGGGHETAYGHFLGYASRRRRVRILNWDAHTDVRALVDGEGHSGSPFRQALEHASRACVDYTVAGLQQHSVARSHEVYITERGGRCIWRTELDAAHIVAIVEEPGERMVSFDLDAVDQSCAPGVSAPSTGGLTIDEWLTAARMSGRGPNVHSCDIVELNPAFDRDGQTARLAALTVWHILRGVAERER